MTFVIDELKTLVSLQLGIKNINDDDRFLEDLGAESLDVVNIIAAVEDKFQIEINESEIPYVLTPSALYQLVKSRI